VTGAVVALRPVRDDDSDFSARVYASTRDQELAPLPWTADQKATFIAQQFAAQSIHYAKHYADASWDVIVIDGRRAGRLIVHRGDVEINVVDIALLPEYRGRGVGTTLLRAILSEADAAGLPVTVHVEHMNPARRLYERLGFVSVEDRGVYLKLERRPQPDQAKIAS
jgi:ribosomal protein S18 acetylase RimI-like enzyme